MQKILLLIASLFYFNFILAENEIKSWQGIHETPLSRLEQQFAEPPVEFANHVIWGWEGKMDKKTICNDLDSIKKKGFRAVIFEAGYKLPFKYLSEEWFLMFVVCTMSALFFRIFICLLWQMQVWERGR